MTRHTPERHKTFKPPAKTHASRLKYFLPTLQTSLTLPYLTYLLHSSPQRRKQARTQNDTKAYGKGSLWNFLSEAANLDLNESCLLCQGVPRARESAPFCAIQLPLSRNPVKSTVTQKSLSRPTTSSLGRDACTVSQRVTMWDLPIALERESLVLMVGDGRFLFFVG